jgi:hypothetical protein
MGEQQYLQGPVGPGASTNNLASPDRPIIGSTTYVETKTMDISTLTSMEDVARAPVTVTVDGAALLDGPQEAKALALLGISEEVLDMAWRRFVVDTNGPPPGPSWPDGSQAHQHQEGMGWRVEVEVVQDRTEGIGGLANVDPRSVKRWVTYTAREWYYTDADIAADGVLSDPPPTGNTVVTSRPQPLEAAGALGASWQTVDADEIDSTVHTAEILLAARKELGWALKEIQVALKVADAAWQGPRSEATKYHFGEEYEDIGAIWASVEAWKNYLEDLVVEQRKAKDASDALKRELGVEIALLVFPYGRVLKLVFSAGRAATTALAGGRVLTYAQKIERIVVPLRTRYGALVDRIARSNKAWHATRILARGTGGLATTAAVNEAGDRPTTPTDWMLAYAMAGAGHLASEWMSKRLAKIELKHGVSFVRPALVGAADGTAQRPIKGAFTDDSLTASFDIGVAAEVFKHRAEGPLKKALAETLYNDPPAGLMERAQTRFKQELKKDNPDGRLNWNLDDMKLLDKYIAEEIEAAVNRRVDPLLDFTYSVTSQAAESAHKTVTTPGPSRADLPTAPRGTVTQPVKN